LGLTLCAALALLAAACPARKTPAQKTPGKKKTGLSPEAAIEAADAKAMKGKSGMGLTPEAMKVIQETYAKITSGKRAGVAEVKGDRCALIATWPEPKAKGALDAEIAQTSGDQHVRVAVTRVEGRPTSDEIGATKHAYDVKVMDGKGRVLAEGVKEKDAPAIDWKGQ